MARRRASETNIQDPGTRASAAQTQRQSPHTQRSAPRTTAPPVDAGPRLMQVRAGRVLLWPNQERRGKAGYCVMSDDPFIKGMEHVLAPAPEGAKADPIDHPVYLRKLQEVKREEMRRDGKRDRKLPEQFKREKPPLDSDVEHADLPDADEGEGAEEE